MLLAIRDFTVFIVVEYVRWKGKENDTTRMRKKDKERQV